MSEAPPRSSFQPFRGRSTHILVILLLMIGILPLLQQGDWSRRLLSLLFILIVVGGALAAADRPRHKIIASILAIPVVLGFVLGELTDKADVGSRALFAVFLGYTTCLILGRVARTKRVTGDTIASALCAYLLIGLIWSVFYGLVHTIVPSAFAFANGEPDTSQELTREFIYFSYVTQTTLGYGDISPVAPAARSLAILEAIIGQFYVAVLIARLLALQVVHARQHEE